MFLLIIEVYLAFTLLIAGIAKVDDATDTVAVLRMVRFFPTVIIPVLSKIISWFEIVVAVALISGVFSIYIAPLNVMLFGSFTIFKLQIFYRKLPVGCGCFGTNYKRSVDSVSLTVSAIQFLLALLCLVLTKFSSPVDNNIRFIVFMTFVAFAGFVLWRITQKRKLRLIKA